MTHTEINKKLNSFCSELGKGDAVNFQCNIEIYAGEWLHREKEEKILKKIMGNGFIVRNIVETNIIELSNEFNESLSYLGDNGAHPNTNFIKGSSFNKELYELSKCLESFFDGCKTYAFYVKNGHPFYPVFWDFAFLLKKGNEAYILIGSSSD